MVCYMCIHIYILFSKCLFGNISVENSKFSFRYALFNSRQIQWIIWSGFPFPFRVRVRLFNFWKLPTILLKQWEIKEITCLVPGPEEEACRYQSRTFGRKLLTKRTECVLSLEPSTPNPWLASWTHALSSKLLTMQAETERERRGCALPSGRRRSTLNSRKSSWLTKRTDEL